jgi:flagellar biosynthesis/type III secretory pathway protein FliH
MGVIKASDALARRARFPDIRVPALPTAAQEVTPFSAARHDLEQRVEALSEQLAELENEKAELAEALSACEAELAQAARDHETALADAEERGRADGLAAGAEAKAESLELLEAGTSRAVDQLRSDLKGMETLAVALAKAGLAKVFGDDRDMARRVERLIRRQLEGLERASILRVEVSATDFTGAVALDGLSDAAGLEGIEVKAVDALGPGDCRMRLRLGELEVGIGQQWARLSGLLDDVLAREERP